MTKNLMRKSAVGLFVFMFGFFFMSPIIAQGQGVAAPLAEEGQLLKEDQQKLDDAKASAKAEIDAHFRKGTSPADFTGTQSKELESVRESGKTDIENANDISDTLAKIIIAIDSVLTDAESAEKNIATKAFDDARGLFDNIDVGTRKKFILQCKKIEEDIECAKSALTSEQWQEVQKISQRITDGVDSITRNAEIIKPLENGIDFIKILLYIALGLIFLSIAFIIFGLFFFLPKKQKKNEDYFRTTLQALQGDIHDLKRDVADRLHTTSSQTEKLFEPRVAKIENDVFSFSSRLKELEKNEKPVNSPVLAPVISRTGEPVTDFNTWAMAPSSILPYGFYYVKGDIRVRTPQPFEKSDSETKWISNENGGKKYLFPNPNLFGLTTDIHELYKMDQSKLRQKGLNRIKITKPCEIEEKGVINYGGELQLL